MLIENCETVSSRPDDTSESTTFPTEFGRAKNGDPIEVPFEGEHFYIVGMTGSGKSFAIRRIAEIALVKCHPILILDIENEFASLREAFPEIYLISETSLLRFLEGDNIQEVIEVIHNGGASAIFELKGLGLAKQQEVVAATITALMNMMPPYRPRVIIIDEAHLLASSETKTASRWPVEDLTARGRKQMLTAVLATQRHTKVSVNARSQAAHKLVGLNKEPGEVDAIAKDLGLNAEAKAKCKRLRRGEFFYSCNSSENPTLLDVSQTISRHGTGEAHIDALAFPRIPFDVVVRELQAINTSRRAGEGPLPGRKNQKTKSVTIEVSLETQEPAASRPDTEQRILAILGAADGLTHDELGLLLSMRPGSIAFDASLLELQRAGLVKRGKSSVKLTEAGRGETAPKKSIAVLAAELRSKVPAHERNILDVIVAAKREPVTLSEIAAKCGLSPRSHKLPKALARQSRFGLIKKVRETYAPSPAYLRLLGR